MTKHLYTSNSDDEVSRRMNFDRYTLAFPTEIEKKFHIKYFHDSLIQFRVSFFLVIILYGVFGFLDWMVIAQYAQLFNFIRFAIIIPLLSLVLIFSFSKYFIRVWQELLFICFIVAGAGITVMTLLAPENYTYYAGMMLIFSAGYFFIKLRFFLASLAGWLTLIIFNIGAFAFSSIGTNMLISNNFFFISANFIGMFAAYNIEFYTRKDFFLNQQLDNHNADIAEINKNLESKVAERTIELVQAKELAEQSDKLKTAFLANMSHEIRTPMNGILGFAQLLENPGLAGEQQQEYIEIIKLSGNRMLNIINDIVDISKIEAGLMEVHITETDINEQTSFIYTFFKYQAKDKGLSFAFNNGFVSNRAIIKTDSEKLYAILTNLVKNAIKFTDEGSIEFGYKLIENQQHAPQIEFYVKDTGIGIPADRLKAIFDRFVQADISDIRAHQGAGLGLSISKAYIEMLGGKIRVESQEGAGSIFYFTLPYNLPDGKNIKTPFANPLPEANPLRELKILVAEDDSASAELINATLKAYCKEIINVQTGLQAIDICLKNPDINLVMMDIKMPVMDGFEASRQIRKFNQNVIIIAQTAYALKGDREKAIQAGCNDYISKPLNVHLLIDLLQKHFRQDEKFDN